MKRLEYTQKDFQWTQWTPDEIRKELRKSLDEKRKVYAGVKNVPASERTFENTIYAIESSNHGMWRAHAASVLMNMSPIKEVRDAAKDALEALEKELVDIEYDETLYRAVKEYEAKQEPLSGADEKLFNDLLRSYRRMGFELQSEKREALKANLKKLAALSSQFSKTINDYQDSIAVTKEELKGLPENYIASLKQNNEGKYIVTLEYPDFIPFMENAENAEKREELSTKYWRKGGEENSRVAEEILRLRQENAELLGYSSHAAFQTEVKMVKNTKTATGFVLELMQKVEAGVKEEMQELQDLKKRLTGDEKAHVEFYDIAYLSNRLKKEKFSVDSEKVREYFPLDEVKAGTFHIYSELFSVTFEKVPRVMLWHEDVDLYAVKNLDGKVVSYFATDLYPREGKYGHAAAFNVISGRNLSYADDAYVTPFATMVANFPKPGENPSLLSHDEVETFFHEFGHIMHEILTECRYQSQSGFSTAWDFVEAPSQMLEHWVWNKETLAILSGHYKTGENLPDELLDNMLKAKNHMIAYWVMRQLTFALFDMEIHTEEPKSAKVLNWHYRDIVKKYIGVMLPEDSLFLSGFGHFSGYDAGYYGYMWSKVYAVDMFTRFEKEGLLNPKTGGDYRREILAVGSSRDEMESVRAFLKREPSDEAFLKEIGL